MTGGRRSLDRVAIATEHLVPAADPYPSPPWKGLRTTEHAAIGRWSYTVYPTGERELYDLRADPWQLHNVADDPAYRGTWEAVNRLWWQLHYPRPWQPFRPTGWWPPVLGGCAEEELRCPDGDAGLKAGRGGALEHLWDLPVPWAVQLPEG